MITGEVTFNVDQLLAKLEALAAANAAQAVDLGAAVVQVNAVGGLAVGGFCVAAAVVAAFVARTGIKKYDDDDLTYNQQGAWQIVGVFAAIIAIFFSVGALVGLGNPWNWVGLFNPKLALAHELFVRLTQ